MPRRGQRIRPAEPHEVAEAFLDAITVPAPPPPTTRDRVIGVLLVALMAGICIGAGYAAGGVEGAVFGGMVVAAALAIIF